MIPHSVKPVMVRNCRTLYADFGMGIERAVAWI
jgi:hypothetical protein